MLVVPDGEGALAIGQLSHSWLSGQLVRAWGNEHFAVPEPSEEVALGAEQHDVGWALADLAPRLSERTGLPCSFLEGTVEEHLAIWETAPDRLLSASATAALVVSMHGRSLSELRAAGAADGDRPALERHVEAERARRQRLRGSLGLGEDEARVIQRLMWTWDGMSLALCQGWSPFTAKDVPGVAGLVDLDLRRGDEGTWSCEPWPFSAPRVEVRCQARRLASSYTEEAQMRRALAQAPIHELELVLTASPVA